MSQLEDPTSIPVTAPGAALDNLSAAVESGLHVDRSQSCWVICLEGDIGVAQAGELQSLLLEGVASGKELRLDLERVGQIDITVLQLAWAAGLAGANGGGIVRRLPSQAASIARDAGFSKFPGDEAVE